MNDKYIVKVAPLVRLPIARTQVFSYLDNGPLPPGTLVSIPFYKRTIEGIVISAKGDFPRHGGMQLKFVNRVIEKSYLKKEQIELAQILSQYYLSPLGVFLKAMTPKIAKIRNRKSNIENKPRKSRVFVCPEAEEIIKSKKAKVLVIGPAAERLRLDASLIAKILKSKKQILIIVPEIYLASAMYEKFSEMFPGKKIALFHGKISKGKFYDQWNKTKEGKIKVIIATKMGVFLPFSDLGIAVVEEEQDISHKQWDMSPRYNAVRAAEFLADQYGAKLVLASSSPSVVTFWRAKEEKWPILNVSRVKDNTGRTEIVDLYKERKSHDFPISKILYANISKTLERKQKVLLIVKRRGYSTFSICQDCKKVLKCPECDRALIYSDEAGSYRCLHCGFRADLFSQCPGCGSLRFSHRGIGTQLVEKKIKRLYPAARVSRFDIDKLNSLKAHKDLNDKLREDGADIVVGTQFSLKLGGFFDFDLVGVISAHDFLNIPDFNSDELALANFRLAMDAASEGGHVVVQTFSPRDTMFEYLVSKKYAEFFDREIKMRKKLSHPPFARMIKLSYRDYSEKKAKTEVEKMFGLLQKAASHKMEISDPFESLAAKKRGKFARNILIKVAGKSEIRDSPIYPILGALKKGWTVDVDPINTV